MAVYVVLSRRGLPELAHYLMIPATDYKVQGPRHLNPGTTLPYDHARYRLGLCCPGRWSAMTVTCLTRSRLWAPLAGSVHMLDAILISTLTTVQDAPWDVDWFFLERVASLRRGSCRFISLFCVLDVSIHAFNCRSFHLGM
ncbi:hypothetical protein OBBRIDRAFT_327621 [Obba rivulosa]|uniref:Uncharacterized protein n=1 Tax=Obba rivulosa TaxID=1052685 RepID=A0A8E2DPF9_9APHY|nr:hypothetical protein OBBRIDRAFT_327621 [Obba rivulosa]